MRGRGRADDADAAVRLAAGDAPRVLGASRRRRRDVLHRLMRPCSGATAAWALLALLFALSARHTVLLYLRKATDTSGSLGASSSTAAADAPGLCRCAAHPPPSCAPLPSSCGFRRLLWFVTDALPSRLARRLFTAYAPRGRSWLITTEGFQFSHAIYTTFLTGEAPTNYEGRAITGDSLLERLRRRDLPCTKKDAEKNGGGGGGGGSARTRPPPPPPLVYVGPEWSFLKIVGDARYAELFEDIVIADEPYSITFSRAYPVLFERSRSVLRAVREHSAARNAVVRPPTSGVLDRAAAAAEPGHAASFLDALDGRSLIATTGVFDHVQHDSPPGYPSVDELARRTVDDLITLRAWVDAHPEYLLVLSSDHGVDERGDAGFILHGRPVDGNQAFLLMYNPQLPAGNASTAAVPETIDVVDVAPTIALALADVDVPQHSLGLGRAVVSERCARDSAGAATAVLRARNAEQLTRLAAARGYTVARGDAAAAKAALYAAVRPPWGTALFAAVVLTAAVVVLLRTARALWRRGRAAGALAVAPYVIAVQPVLFCWWRWRARYARVPQLLASGLTVAVLGAFDRSQLRGGGGGAGRGGGADAVERGLAVVQLCNWAAAFAGDVFDDAVDAVGAAAGDVLWLAAVVLAVRAAWRTPLARTAALASVAYDLTADWTALHVASLHPAALATLGALAAWAVRSRSAVRPFIGLVYFVHAAEPGRRVAVLVASWLLWERLVPACARAVQQGRAASGSVVHSTAPEAARATVALLLTLNQVLIGHTVWMRDQLTVSVTPSAGRVGVLTHDAYPLFNATLMAVHKFGLLLLLLPLVVRLGRIGASWSRTQHVLPLALVMSSASASLGFALLLAYYNHHMGLQESLLTVLLHGAAGATFAASRAWDSHVGDARGPGVVVATTSPPRRPRRQQQHVV